MKKQFERADLRQNDDGTYTISVTPLRKKGKGDGESAITFQEDKTYTAASLDDAMEKIRGFSADGENDETQEGDDISRFMNPMRGMAKEKESEKEDE